MAGIERDRIEQVPHRYDTLPVLGRIAKDFDQSIRLNGLHGAAVELIRRAGVRLEVRLGDETKEVLANEPVFLVANHPHVVEVAPLVASLPPRENTFVVSGLDYVTIGPNVFNHLIPVSSNGTSKFEDLNYWARIFEKMEIGPKFGLSPEEEMVLNRDAFVKICRVIKEGGMAIFFPDGGRKKGSKWFSGIGHLAKKIARSGDSYLIWAFVEGTSNFDLLRLIPRVGKLLPSVHANVTYSDPQKLSDIIHRESDPRKLANLLQEDYFRWVESI